MKKMLLVMFLGIFVVGINLSCSKSSKAFEAYKTNAEQITLKKYAEEKKLKMRRYGTPTVPEIISIEYELPSSESVGDGKLKLTVAEIIRFDSPDDDARMGRLFKHDVLMQKGDDGNWKVVEVEIEQIKLDRKQPLRPNF